MAKRPKFMRLKRKRYKEGKRKYYPEITLNDKAENAGNDFPTNAYHTTKYTVLTYLPKLLKEQYRKLTTVYFTLIVIITLIPDVTPLTPLTSVPGLLFILITAAIREGYEDLQRFKADKKVNQKQYMTLEAGSGAEKPTISQDIRVGDIVYIKQGEQIPADVVVLASGLPDGVCYIETASLDGETNLKRRKAPKLLDNLSPQDVCNLRGTIEAETPRHIIYTFKGSLQLENGERSSLDKSNLLLMSSFLRNTPWACGVVVYAGPETKLSLNQKLPPSKFSSFDKRLNRVVIGIFTIKSCICLLLAILGGWYEGSRVGDTFVEEDPNSSSGVIWGVKLFFSYFVLLSFMIPLSLVVSLEIVKVVQARFMEWDPKMATDPKHTNTTGMTVKTSNLNDELGLVKFIFSDKTGTLTENHMDFKKASIGHNIYDNVLEGSLKDVAQGGDDLVRNYMLGLALCNSVVRDENCAEGEEEYKAASPDEVALVLAANANGFEFVSRTNEGITLNENGKPVVYEILGENEFTSERRRMSILVRLPDGRIRLFIKGADTTIYERLRSDGDSGLRQATEQNLDTFATEGLRTLAMGYRDLSDAEFVQYHEAMEHASNLLDEREEAMEVVADEWERDLTLLGCTAIEDRLQDRVPETIAYLQRAGINVWVITGDKQLTAINIAYSCKLLRQEMTLRKLNAETSEECHSLMQDILSSHSDKGGQLAIVTDGHTLKFALNEHPDLFVDLTTRCKSVICCQVTPIQKARVVKLVKESQKVITLAVGDGANDVSMIQEAHVGVGIYGKEGTQAARSSDFAIRQFKHLQRLICVHGRWSAIRNALLVQYSFYKNAATFIVQVWFAFFCAWSAQSLYDDFLMTLFNITITSLPILFVGFFEKDIGERIIERHPQVFQRTQSNTLFTYKSLSTWFFFAAYHSLVFFWFGLLVYDDGVIFGSDGTVGGLRLLGNMVITLAITTIFLKLALEVQNWNWVFIVGFVGSYLGFYLTLMLESLLLEWWPQQYWQFFQIITLPQYWFLIPIGVALCLLPDLTYKLVQRTYFPEDWQILQEHYREVAAGNAQPLPTFEDIGVDDSASNYKLKPLV